MGDDDDSGIHLVTDIHHFFDDDGLVRDVQGRGRFIGEKELRFHGHCHGDADTLTHAAGEFVRVAFQDVLRIRETHHFDHGNHQVMGFFVVLDAMDGEKFAEFGTDGTDRIHHGAAVLENHGDVCAAERAMHFRGLLLGIFAFKNDLTFRYMTAAGQDVLDSTDDGGFP